MYVGVFGEKEIVNDDDFEFFFGGIFLKIWL